ncbi:MAG: hypothetical protein Q7K42_02240, partial [Candidatus Diapherotrites archaeon]|nr:hypothetical protein [Candidatus Diapherotrites archaeon]
DNKEALDLVAQIRKALAEKDYKKVEELGSSIDSLFKEKERRDEFQGWSGEEVEKVFGKPSEFDEFVWAENLNKSIRVNESLPRWEKVIFEGKKIKILFTAFPHLTEYKDSLKAFYWIDIQLKFKTIEQDFEKEKMFSEIKTALNTFTSSKQEQDLKNLASVSASYERLLNDRLQRNKEVCEEFVGEFFDSSAGNEEKVEWKGTFFESDDGVIFWVLNENFSENWHGFNTFFDYRIPRPVNDKGFSQEIDYESLSDEELIARLDSALHDLKELSKGFVSGPNSKQGIGLKKFEYNSINAEQGFSAKRFELEQLVNKISERANRQDSGSSLSVPFLVLKFEELFKNYASDFSKEKISQKNYRNELFKDVVKRTNSYCEGQQEFCGEGNYCQGSGKNFSCVSAKGGNEICDNSSDDDADGFSNCEDPDCSDSKFCSNVCGSACQPLNDCLQANNNDYQKCENFGFECSKCNYENDNIQCPSPQVVNPQNYNCECPKSIQCREGQFIDGATCQCLGEPITETRENSNQDSEIPELELPLPENSGAEKDVNSEEGREKDFDSDNGNSEVNANTSGIQNSLLTGFVSLADDSQNENPQEIRSCDNVQCNSNQFCDPKQGWCSCNPGWFECDGDWLNGCESNKQCKQCEKDSDCAQPRCSESLREKVIFQCKQSDSWEETNSQFEFGAFCGKNTSGKTQTGVWFSAWGKGFERFDEFKQSANSELNENWCEKDLQDAVAERVELQNSLNSSFTDWFFSEFVAKNPNKFRVHEESIRFVYESFLKNSEKTARALNCLGRADWPTEAQPIESFVFESPNGRVEFSEKFSETDFFSEGKQQKLKVLGPYMKMWVFPNKEQFKEIFKTEFKKNAQGPSPAEIEMMRKDEKLKGLVDRISDRFGGKANIFIELSE